MDSAIVELLDRIHNLQRRNEELEAKYADQCSRFDTHCAEHETQTRATVAQHLSEAAAEAEAALEADKEADKEEEKEEVKEEKEEETPEPVTVTAVSASEPEVAPVRVHPLHHRVF